MARIRMFEKSKTVRGDVRAPVIAYVGESGEGEDRCIELEGATLFDKMLALYDAGAYVSIGPAEGSDDWNDLDKEDQSDYRILQARAKKKTTYKQMGDFISSMCDANECFLFALRQGDDAVWINPGARSELRGREWSGDDADWLEDACGVWENYENREMEAIPPPPHVRKALGALAGKNESEEWDNDQYKEWALNDIGPVVDRCWASIESAIEEKYPGATLTTNNDTEVDDIEDQRGRDWSNTTVSLKETGKVTIPVEYDPLEDSPEIDAAVDQDLDSIAAILGEVKFNNRRTSPRQKGDLENPEILFDDVDFEGKTIVIPLTFTYAYHFEDSAY